MSRNQKCRPWLPGEREAIERSFMFPQVVRDDSVPPGLLEIRRVGAEVEADDAADLARTMPEAFGRGS